MTPSRSGVFREKSAMSRIATWTPVLILLAVTAIARAADPLESNPKLYSTLWMQTSAEYQALCQQIYANATQAVLQRAGEMGQTGLPLAVVMDLDETVLDNGVYQQHRMYGGRAPFSEFVAEHKDRIRLVPGAKDFIDAVSEHGIAVVYISNRRDSIAEATVSTLELNGIGTVTNGSLPLAERTQQMKSERRLLLMTGEDHSKRGRRALAAEKYRIVAYFGDKLADFPGPFEWEQRPSPAERRAAVVDVQTDSPRPFGTRWFLLPNTVYGDWEWALGDAPGEYIGTPSDGIQP